MTEAVPSYHPPSGVSPFCPPFLLTPVRWATIDIRGRAIIPPGTSLPAPTWTREGAFWRFHFTLAAPIGRTDLDELEDRAAQLASAAGALVSCVDHVSLVAEPSGDTGTMAVGSAVVHVEAGVPVAVSTSSDLDVPEVEQALARFYGCTLRFGPWRRDHRGVVADVVR